MKILVVQIQCYYYIKNIIFFYLSYIIGGKDHKITAEAISLNLFLNNNH